jgi:serine/threonine-protein kinase
MEPGKVTQKQQLTEVSQHGDASGKDSLARQLVSHKYEIVDEIGSGGWSTVYAAKQLPPLSRLVAIKVLHLPFAFDEIKVQRFQREAAVLVKLDHPNVCRVYDYGLLATGQPYLVLEYLHGNTLDEVIATDGKIDPRRAASISRQLAAALHAAHKQGLIHRDLKPSNVMLINDGSGQELVKLLDFGLAKPSSEHYESGYTLTATGDTMGTPNYMSPEQCYGYKLDARSDIYSLGCVIFEMLTGRRPFDADTQLEIMMHHVHSQPPQLEALGVSKEHLPLIATLERCLQKDRTRRFRTAEEIVAVLDGEVPPPRPVRQTLPAAFMASAVFAGLILAACIIGWNYANTPHDYVLQGLPSKIPGTFDRDPG